MDLDKTFKEKGKPMACEHLELKLWIKINIQGIWANQ
jgi:hypothetical protein